MKRLFLLISLLLSLSSCSVTHYMQLVTLHSDNVSDVDDSFIYRDDNIIIDYIFNKKDGVFEFTVLNISDGDIFIDMKKSVFVYDKMVYDYAGREKSVTAYAESSTTYANAIVSSSGRYAFGHSSTSKKGVSTTSLTKMPSVVLIPKGTYRTFTGFDINDTIYRQLFFARDPKPKEYVCISGDEIKEPISFSNILCVKSSDSVYSVENNFQVVEVRNIYVPENTTVSILPSMYYISYTGKDIDRLYIDDIYGYYFFNDRTDQSLVNSR